jgi:hypothetical protein
VRISRGRWQLHHSSVAAAGTGSPRLFR